jgi:hypothetical protein
MGDNADRGDPWPSNPPSLGSRNQEILPRNERDNCGGGPAVEIHTKGTVSLATPLGRRLAFPYRRRSETDTFGSQYDRVRSRQFPEADYKLRCNHSPRDRSWDVTSDYRRKSRAEASGGPLNSVGLRNLPPKSRYQPVELAAQGHRRSVAHAKESQITTSPTAIRRAGLQ